MKKLFFLVACLIFFASCDNLLLFGKRNVQVVLPDYVSEFEDNVPDFFGWSVEICSEYRRDCFFTVESSFSLILEKNEIGCVLAMPVVKNACGEEICFFKSAGVVFKIDDCLKELKLDWYKGYSAYVMKLLCDEVENEQLSREVMWNYIGRFNWNKMDSVMEERILECEEQGTFYNPWLISPEVVTKAIAFHSFRASLLSNKNVFEIEGLNNNEIYSSFVPENKNIKKNRKILIKQSEVNLISDYNLNSIIVTGNSADNIKIKYCKMPVIN